MATKKGREEKKKNREGVVARLKPLPYRDRRTVSPSARRPCDACRVTHNGQCSERVGDAAGLMQILFLCSGRRMADRPNGSHESGELIKRVGFDGRRCA